MLPRPPGAAAPAALPIAALVASALALAAGGALWLGRPEALSLTLAAPAAVALTHVFTLGFVGLAFAGTLQQLPSVLLNTALAWPRSGLVTLPLLAVGVTLLVVGFARGFVIAMLITGGSAVVVAWSALLAQLLATARRARIRNESGVALITAIGYLWLTVTLGLLLASARSSPELVGAVGYPRDLHLQVGMLGAFLLGIAGAGQKLLSMFALAKGGSGWRLRALIAVVHLLVIAEIGAAFFRLELGGVPTLLLMAAGALQLWEVAAILKRRLRRRLEAPIVRFVLAHAGLVVAAALVVAGEIEAAGTMFLLGFVGLAVSGMAVKITAFLSWTASFAGRTASPGGGAAAGRARAATERGAAPPLLKDMPLAALEPVITVGLALGAALAAAAVATGSATVSLAGASCYTLGALGLLVQLLHVVLVARGVLKTPARLTAVTAQ